MTGMVAAYRRHDRLDLRIGEHAVNIVHSVRRRVGDEPALVERMTSYLYLEAKRSQVSHTPLNAVGEQTCTPPRMD